ncbi:MAG: LysR family transcriptional regulator [Alphaproteobacteria bacterium]|nr:LysR family transcriptional regulator [Alphaproteobacteria bacterium]
MRLRKRWIPSTSALLAFESAARNGHFSRAAEELNTSQSAISRHIAGLEDQLGTKLFERKAGKSALNGAGERLFRSVALGLETIQAAALEVSNAPDDEQLVIACTHEISHLYLMPRFDALQKTAGQPIRIMTFDYDNFDVLADPRIDMVFSYQDLGSPPEHQAVAFSEAVIPVCAPSFAKVHKATLRQGPGAWRSLPQLELTKSNRGWATWEDWFAANGLSRPADAHHLGFDNYVYLLEAAAGGGGLALGWRGLIESYLDAGRLVAVGDQFEEFNRPLLAVLTERAQDRSIARTCLTFVRENSV